MYVCASGTKWGIVETQASPHFSSVKSTDSAQQENTSNVLFGTRETHRNSECTWSLWGARNGGREVEVRELFLLVCLPCFIFLCNKYFRTA